MFQIARENQSTQFVFSNFCFENRAFCEIIWKNIVDSDRPQIEMWHLPIECWIPKATNTHSEYVILIYFALLQ
jgi:hypothetical protein